ncbi:MAG: hypothetical protein PHQ27_01675 [Victivallales bacterium]|nr:hypothetical protein [Victivallales bacterium]
MNRFKSFIMYLVALAATAVLLVGVGISSGRLNQLVKTHHLRATGDIKNAPPIVTFTTVALGSFRGLLADLLWLRALALQDEGNYFEMVQLASWITKLQPRFSGATAFLAWNMAYNISVTCSSPEERWRWISRGIELLRDEAIEYNPEEASLYKELAWIYQHKIGNIMDDANLYYKRQVAESMEKVFGGAPPDWKVWAETPSSNDKFLARLTPDDRKVLERALDDSGYTLGSLETSFRQNDRLPEEFLAKYQVSAEEISRLVTFLRVNWLVNVYKIDPRLVLQINNKYGALDWRLPESYAIYWATKGLEMTPSHKDDNCERVVTQALHDAFVSGRLLMVDPTNNNNIITAPNLNVIDALRAAYIKAYKEDDTDSFRSALINFTKEAVVVFYNFGQYSKAEHYYKLLQKEDPGKKEYRAGMEAFVLKEWEEFVQQASLRQANEIIGGLLFRSCNFLAEGDVDAALGQEQMARKIYLRYMKRHVRTKGRVGLADYNQMKARITESCLKNFPPLLSRSLRLQLEQEKLRAQEEMAEQKKQEEAAAGK